MTTVTADIAVSLDGYAAGPNQSADLPFGEGVDGRLHTWIVDHADENRAEIDAITSAGAYIMGRNMFGPGRGEWDLEWKGWWGPEPPYHAPVFVLTHHPREPLEMDGGTTFTFVTDGPESALAQARGAAGDRQVAIAGGAATLNQ
jgi:dihydrofolate reductase